MIEVLTKQQEAYVQAEYREMLRLALREANTQPSIAECREYVEMLKEHAVKLFPAR